MRSQKKKKVKSICDRGKLLSNQNSRHVVLAKRYTYRNRHQTTPPSTARTHNRKCGLYYFTTLIKTHTSYTYTRRKSACARAKPQTQNGWGGDMKEAARRPRERENEYTCTYLYYVHTVRHVRNGWSETLSFTVVGGDIA